MSLKSNNFRDEILLATFNRFDEQFAGGDMANNKLEFGNVENIPILKSRVVAEVGRLATRHKPDLLVPVPNGANWLATAVAQHLVLSVALLESDDDKVFTWQPEQAAICLKAKRIVIVEDVFTKLHSTRKVLAKPEISGKAVAAVGVFNRGDLQQQPDLGIPVEAVLQEYIPAILPADHSLWSFAPKNSAS